MRILPTSDKVSYTILQELQNRLVFRVIRLSTGQVLKLIRLNITFNPPSGCRKCFKKNEFQVKNVKLKFFTL